MTAPARAHAPAAGVAADPNPPALPAMGAPQGLRWPLPALLTWGGGWGFFLACGAAGVAPLPALLAATLVAAALALLLVRGCWRRGLAAGGFPLSALALHGLALAPWAWACLAVPLLLAYPLRAWRDAPYFPSPADAVLGLAGVVQPPQRVLDAGSGLGHGLRALRRLWPQADVHGIESSPLLAALARWHCRGLRVTVARGDLWAADWAGFDGVYLFQRPESMPRAFAKAQRELKPGGWLASLEFEVPGIVPLACLEGPGRRPLYVYRAGPDSTGCCAGR